MTRNLSNFRKNTTKMRINTLQNGETVAGVELNNNTGSTKQSERWPQLRQNLSNFRENSTKMRSNSRRNGETVAGVELRQQHSKHENRNAITNRDEKMRGPSWNVCSQWHVRVVTWRVAAWLFNVGITSCRRIKLRHFNNARPFWNECIFTSKYGLAEPIQRRLYVTTLYDINQETT